jgi:hypothetical protein
LAYFTYGTGFGKFDVKSMRLSNKDILLLLGIVVAVIVTLTTVVYHREASAAQKIPAPKKTSLNSTAHKLVEFVYRKGHTKFH